MALRKIELMQRLFGKCKAYGNTGSEASDWAKRWLACGLFNKPWKGKPIMRLVRPTRKDKEDMQNTPIDGQLSMEGL